MELNEMEKRLLYQTEGCERYAVINELSMASQYAGDPARRKAAKNLMEKLRPLSDAECMDMVRDIQKNYRLPQTGRAIGELIAEARQKSGAEKLKGHDIMALERFDPEVKHMIVFDVLSGDSPVGDKGDKMRLFLTDAGYQKFLDSQERGEVKLKNHAKVSGGHLHYALGNSHNYMDKDDFLREMYLNTVGHDEQGMKRYERMVNIVGSRYMHGPKTEERAIDDAMLKVISEKYITLPLYLMDHSGLAMKTTSFNDPWDSGQMGWIYVSKEDALKEFGGERMTGTIRKKAEDLMRSEVAAYDSYLRGECYGFELYKNGELSDSCWGFMGDLADACKDMAEYLPEGCKDMVEHLEEQNHPATIIKTLLKHAKIQVDQAAKAFEHALRQQVIGDAR